MKKIFLLLIGIFIFVFIYYDGNILDGFIDSKSSVTSQKIAFDSSKSKDNLFREGNINGAPVSIQSSYLYFPIEYKDKSIWDKNKGKDYYNNKTIKDSISNFSIYVHWPTLKPRSKESEKNNSNGRTNVDNWIVIEIKAKDLSSPYYKEPQKDNALARVLRSRIEEKGTRSLPDGVNYVFKNNSAIKGLSYAVPEGPAAEAADLWNKKLYWDGDIQGNVSTSIHCPNGKFPNSKIVGKCIQYFEIPEIKSIISVRYTPNILSQYKNIQTSSRNLILGFVTNQTK